MSTTILITGATGFLGSNLVNRFNKNNYTIICLKRKNSNCFRVSSQLKNIIWVNADFKGWEKHLYAFKIDYIIHCAWNGVSSEYRDDFSSQMANMQFLEAILKIAKEKKVKKVIGLGSQAEYGYYDGVIDENQNEKPYSYYGVLKLASKNIVKCFCENNDIGWIWLRLFPLFGEFESSKWLIPSLIEKLVLNKEFNMTKGEQKYSYLYVNDFSKIVERIVESNIKSGVYNISSKQNFISLKELVLIINNELKSNINLVKFGALPYRLNQPMLMGGKMTKIEKEIGEIQETLFIANIRKVIQAKNRNI